MDRFPKSLKAVFFPQAFEAFRGIADAAAFERAWRDNRPWMLANMAHAAYFDPAAVRAMMARLGALETKWLQEQGACAYLAAWPDKAVLAFRGTQIDQPRDLLTDLDVFKAQGAVVHRGFWRRIETLWDAHVRPRLEALPARAKASAFVTGHSLGGALATLAALRWPFSEAVTFGEPRVGLGIDAQLRCGRHLRYVNGRDLVPRMPPRVLGYGDHGEMVRITDPDGESRVYDHSIVYYAEILGVRA